MIKKLLIFACIIANFSIHSMQKTISANSLYYIRAQLITESKAAEYCSCYANTRAQALALLKKTVARRGAFGLIIKKEKKLYLKK